MYPSPCGKVNPLPPLEELGRGVNTAFGYPLKVSTGRPPIARSFPAPQATKGARERIKTSFPALEDGTE